jgi:hypothetical protein
MIDDQKEREGNKKKLTGKWTKTGTGAGAGVGAGAGAGANQK